MGLTRVQSTLPPETESVARQTISALLAVHREFGAGMNEGVYAAAARFELGERRIAFESEKLVPVRY